MTWVAKHLSWLRSRVMTPAAALTCPPPDTSPTRIVGSPPPFAAFADDQTPVPPSQAARFFFRSSTVQAATGVGGDGGIGGGGGGGGGGHGTFPSHDAAGSLPELGLLHPAHGMLLRGLQIGQDVLAVRRCLSVKPLCTEARVTYA